MKTQDEITTEIYRYVKASALAAAVSGKVINGKDRSPKSSLEDVVVKVLGGRLGQVQECYVNVNIYVPDTYHDGQYEKDDERVPLLERTAMDLFEKPIHIDAARITIDSQTTMPSNSGKEHVINNKLLYQIINE